MPEEGPLMAITAYPFENQDTTESQFSAWARELQDTGVVGSFGDASLRVAADSTGMQVKVSPGAAFVRGHYVSSTAVETKAIAAATSQPRIDVVVARLNPGSDSITLEVVQGTPATTPEPPALTQTDTGVYEMPLARVTVPASAATIAASNVAEVRPFIGHRVGAWSTDTRPSAPRRGRLGLNTTSNTWEWHNGTGWVALAPTVTWGSISGAAPFALLSHTHDQGDIVGLATALAGKAPVSHTHTKAQIDGLQADLTYLATYKSDVGHNHTAAQVTYAGTNVQIWAGSVDSAFNTVRADIAYLSGNKANGWGGSTETVRYANGPSGNAYTREAGASRYAVWMDSGLEFGRAASSLRYKDHVTPWDVDIDALLSIEPKTFHRKVDDDGVMDFGAIAEEVHEAGLTELVYYDDQGRPDALREHHLPWALLAVIRAQQAQIDELARRIGANDA